MYTHRKFALFGIIVIYKVRPSSIHRGNANPARGTFLKGNNSTTCLMKNTCIDSAFEKSGYQALEYVVTKCRDSLKNFNINRCFVVTSRSNTYRYSCSLSYNISFEMCFRVVHAFRNILMFSDKQKRKN